MLEDGIYFSLNDGLKLYRLLLLIRLPVKIFHRTKLNFYSCTMKPISITESITVILLYVIINCVGNIEKNNTNKN